MRRKKLQWISVFCSITLIIVFALMTVCYIVDPFFAYRVRDNTYMLPDSSVLPGIIKNHDYDALVIGTSMTQNFNMDSFREKININPAKISAGGMVLNDLKKLTVLANKIGKARSYYICLDLPRFTNDSKIERVPDYLCDDNILNDYKYLLGYSVWMRFIPVDLALVTAKKIGINFNDEIESKLEIDELGYWGDSFEFGREIVISGYKNSSNTVSEINIEDCYQDIIDNTDSLIESLGFGDYEYNFFFPPYSVLYWCNAETQGYFDSFLKGKEYLVTKLKEKGCNVYDFQAADFVSNLDYYKDTTHYSPQINEWMVDCFSEKLFLTDKNSVKMNNIKLKEIVKEFKIENSDIFKN